MLVLVCGAKWKWPVEPIQEACTQGNDAICASKRENESSAIG